MAKGEVEYDLRLPIGGLDHLDSPVEPPWYRIEGSNPERGGRCSFPGHSTPESALSSLGDHRAEHPEYTHWYLLKFEPFVRTTVEKELT